MNINVIDQTILGIDTDHVKQTAMAAMAKLTARDGVSINVVMTDAIAIAPPDGSRHMHTVGVCQCMPPYPHRFVVRVVHIGDWKFTLYHELYHVYEHINGAPANETACDAFATGLTQ